MVKQNNNVLLLVGLMVIVGVIASVAINAVITGNSLKVIGSDMVGTVEQNTFSKQEVYTKTEVQNQIDAVVNPLRQTNKRT